MAAPPPASQSENTPADQPDPQAMQHLLDRNIRDYAIFLLDPDGRVLTWNAGAQRIKGFRAEEIVGRHFSEFYPAEDVVLGKPERELAIARAEGRVEDEGWRVRRDGSLFWANVVITALYDEEGLLRGYAKVTRDMTERRRAEQELRESEERFRLLVQDVTDYAIFMLDATGHVISWNAGAERIKGYTGAEIHGRHFSVAIVDVRMPGGGALAARGVHAQSPDTRILAFSAHNDSGAVEEMERAGVDEFLVKGTPVRQIVAAIRALTRSAAS